MEQMSDLFVEHCYFKFQDEIQFLARDSIYAIAHSLLTPVRPSVPLSVRPSVPLSVTRVDQSKTVTVRITQPSPQSSPMTVVSSCGTAP